MYPKKILVVDDEEVIRQLCQRLLGKLGFDLILAGTVEAALSTIDQSTLDLLVTDLKLPDGSGTEIIFHFKNKFQTSGVVVMTGSATPEDRLASCAGLVSSSLMKPFDKGSFISAVTNALECRW